MGQACEEYLRTSVLNTCTAGIFAIGIFASYIPQQVIIIRRKTIEGISPYFLLLMNMGSILSFTNIIILSNGAFECCRTRLTPFYCISSLMGLFQIAAGFAAPLLTLALAMKFNGGNPKILLVGKAVLLFDSILMLLVYFASSRSLATIFGMGALIVGLIQYLPQIWTTYCLKHTGSLSLITMLIQVPGGYLWCLSLATRHGSHWSTWISLFMAATLNFILFLMGIYYNSRGKPEGLRPMSPLQSPAYGATVNEDNIDNTISVEHEA